MKFAKALQIERVPEWKEKYIDYNGLLDRLRLIKRAMRTREAYLMRTSIDNDDYIFSNSAIPQSATRRSVASQRAMSLTSVAESANSFLSKVSTKLIQWRKNLSNFSTPDHRPRNPITSIDTIMEQLNPDESALFGALDNELHKITLFYEEREKDALDFFTKLKSQFEDLKNLKNKKKSRLLSEDLSKLFKGAESSIGSPDEQQRQPITYETARKRIRKAIFEFYRSLELLQSYRRFNYSALCKVLNKFDEITGLNGSKVYMPKILECNFVNSNKLDMLKKGTEDVYITYFEEGSRRLALKKLRTSYEKSETHHDSTFRVGIYFGLVIPFLIRALQHVYENSYARSNTLDEISTFPNNNITDNYTNSRVTQFYVGLTLPITLAILLGVNMYVWTRARINYKFIFEFDSRNNLDIHQYLELPALIFLITILIMNFNISNLFDIDLYFYPISLIIIIIITIFCPIRILYYDARRWFILSMGRVISAFTFINGVEFRDFFIADGLNSLSFSLMSLELYACPLSKGYCRIIDYTRIIYFMPALIRIFQCVNRFHCTRRTIHLINAGKYLSTIISLHLLYHWRNSPFERWTLIAWLISQCVSSSYTYVWDVYMDWSLMNIYSHNYLLRDNLGFKHTWVYYFAIISNFFLRFSWILYLILNLPWIGYAVAFGEIIRRWQWNFIRVENEHIINCSQYRATKEIQTLLPFLDEDPIIVPVDDVNSSDSVPKSLSTIIQNLFNINKTQKSGWQDFSPRSDRNEDSYSDEDEDSYDNDEVHDSLMNLRGKRGKNRNMSSIYSSRKIPMITEKESSNDHTIYMV